MSDSLQPCGLWHAKFLCLPLYPRVCLSSWPFSWWYYLTTSSSVAPFSFNLRSFPASGSFPTSWLFASGGQSIRVSASASVLPMDIQSWFPLGLTGLISLKSKGLLQHHNSKASILQCSAFFIVQLSHPYMTTGKTMPLTVWTFVDKVRSFLFYMVSRFVTALLPKRRASFVFMAAAIVHSDCGAPENKICHCFHFSPFCLPWSDGTRCPLILVFWMLSFKPAFHWPLSPSLRGSLVPLHFLL